MVVGILRLAHNAPKVAKRIQAFTSDGGKTSRMNTPSTIFTDYELYKTKMRGQIGSNAPGGANVKYDKNFIGPKKSLESILKKNYTGSVKKSRSKGEEEAGLTPLITEKTHPAQTYVRNYSKDEIKVLNDSLADNGLVDADKQFNVYKRGTGRWANTNDLLDYVKRGVQRHGSMYQNPGLAIHPDFVVPPELDYMVDFTKQISERNVPGFITNFQRNVSYHKHYENNLYRYLTEKKLINQAYKDGMISKARRDADLKKADEFISKIKTDMTNLGL